MHTHSPPCAVNVLFSVFCMYLFFMALVRSLARVVSNPEPTIRFFVVGERSVGQWELVDY